MDFGQRCRWCAGLMLYVCTRPRRKTKVYHCPACDIRFPTGGV